MINKFKYFVVGVVLLVLLFVSTSLVSQPSISIIYASYAKLYTVKEAAYEASNIVLGKIIRNEKDRYYPWGEGISPIPRTDSVVHIEQNIKGNLDGDFVFQQDGGLDKKTNTMYLINGYDTIKSYDILTPGQQYLFFIKRVSDDHPSFVPNFMREHPELIVKYYSVGGPPAVYRIEGKKAKNVVMPEFDKDYSEIEQIISKKLNEIVD